MAGKAAARKRGKDGRFKKEAPKRTTVAIPESPHKTTESHPTTGAATYSDARRRLVASTAVSRNERLQGAIDSVDKGLSGNIPAQRAAEERFGPIRWN